MKIKSSLFFLFLSLFLFSCSGDQKSYITVIGETQGTTYTIVYYSADNKNYKSEIDSILVDFSNSLSTYIPGSLISIINESDTPVVADEYFTTVLNRSKEISIISSGAFDVTVAPLVNAWGFGFKNKETMDSARVDSILRYIGYSKIKIEDGKAVKENRNVMVDFNSIAQGYSADVVAKFLEQSGITDYMVEIGGEIMAKGKNSKGQFWKIGIYEPTEGDSKKLFAMVKLNNKGLATSGNYRNFYYKDGVRYAHTINPITGYPVNHSLLSATVIGPDGMTADAMATVCMVVGLEKAIEIIESDNSLDAFLIYSGSDGKYEQYVSQGLKEMMEKGE